MTAASTPQGVTSWSPRQRLQQGRDGGLTKIDIPTGAIVGRVAQGGNSIGGAISQDGRMVAVANYTPGGIKVFDTDTLASIADIPAVGADGEPFIYSLYDAGETWIADLSEPATPKVTKFTGLGRQPYDGLITPVEDSLYRRSPTDLSRSGPQLRKGRGGEVPRARPVPGTPDRAGGRVG